MTQTQRPDFHRFHNGSKVALPFSDAEYEARLAGLRAIMGETGVTAAIFTSMHNIAYYCGFLYCAFGRPYGLVVTDTECVTILQASTQGNLGVAALATTSPIRIGSETIIGVRLLRLWDKELWSAMKAITCRWSKLLQWIRF